MRFAFFGFIYSFRSCICVRFQLVAFVREHILLKALIKGYSIKLELTREKIPQKNYGIRKYHESITETEKAQQWERPCISCKLQQNTPRIIHWNNLKNVEELKKITK